MKIHIINGVSSPQDPYSFDEKNKNFVPSAMSLTRGPVFSPISFRSKKGKRIVRGRTVVANRRALFPESAGLESSCSSTRSEDNNNSASQTGHWEDISTTPRQHIKMPTANDYHDEKPRATLCSCTDYFYSLCDFTREPKKQEDGYYNPELVVAQKERSACFWR